jgi:hypothetical protein
MQAGGSRGFASASRGNGVAPETPASLNALAVNPPGRGPSEAWLAARLGMTRQGLRKARATGRCSQSKEVEVLRRELAENTNPALRRPKPGHKPAASPLAAHRARFEAARAREKELKVKMLEGSLVDRQRAAALFYEAGKRARESWEQWPSRVAAMIAAELDVPAHTVEQVLTKHVKEHLRKIPQDLRAQFR